MPKEFSGKTVVITGAGGMLGRVLAASFAREGARLVLVDLDIGLAEKVGNDLRRQGCDCTSHELDLAIEADIQRLGARLCETHSAIHALCNNAGIHGGAINLPVDQVNQASWLRYFSVNTLSPLLLAQALRPALKTGKGAIVNQSSMASYSPLNPYGLTKLSLNAMTHAMASAFASDGIRVNAVAPGLIDTELNRSAMPADTFERIQTTQMLRQTGTPEDIAELTVFLASERSRFITSEVVSCDGGSSIRGWHV